MVNKDQIQNGILKYVDEELVKNNAGLGRWIIPVILPYKIGEYLSMLDTQKDALIKMGYMHDDGMIEIERIYNDFRTVADKYGNVVVALPLIGSITFSRQDIDNLYMHIIS